MLSYTTCMRVPEGDAPKDTCFEVVDVKGRGRGVVAKRDVQPGEVIFREAPAIVVTHPSLQNYVCAACFRMPEGTDEELEVRCEACQQVRYCSEDCCNAALESHCFYECQVMKQAADRFSEDEEAQALARFLCKAYTLKLTADDWNGKNGRMFKELSDLSGEEIKTTAEEISNIAQIHELIASVIPNGCTSFEETKGLALKDRANTFGMMAPMGPEGERRVRGNATYLMGSRINHDCLPNVTRFEYYDSQQKNHLDTRFRAMHAIPAGTEFVQSYFPINQRYSERQERLNDDYGFICYCNRCVIESTWNEDDSDDEDDEEEEAENEPALDDNATAKEKMDAYLRAPMKDEPEQESDDDEGGEEGGEDNFEHAIYFVKYLCPEDDCGGTFAPLEGRANLASGEYVVADSMECNNCGKLRHDSELYSLVESLSGD